MSAAFNTAYVLVSAGSNSTEVFAADDIPTVINL
jgi:hypothetical protein